MVVDTGGPVQAGASKKSDRSGNAGSAPLAIILAGGRGARLRPFTLTIPKPLVPLGDVPIVEIMIRRLSRFGFGRIVLAVNHMGDLIQAYCGDGSRWGVELGYSLESEPLGTIGPLRQLADLPEHFLVVNADVLSDIDFGGMLANHAVSGAILTVATTVRRLRLDYGIIEEAGGALVGFEEKPELDHLVSMGIYAVSRRALAFIPPTGPFGFDGLVANLLAAEQRVDVLRHQGFWFDIGKPDDYERANQKFAQDLDGYV